VYEFARQRWVFCAQGLRAATGARDADGQGERASTLGAVREARCAVRLSVSGARCRTGLRGRPPARAGRPDAMHADLMNACARCSCNAQSSTGAELNRRAATGSLWRGLPGCAASSRSWRACPLCQRTSGRRGVSQPIIEVRLAWEQRMRGQAMRERGLPSAGLAVGCACQT
jgi:hypothetical protein